MRVSVVPGAGGGFVLDASVVLPAPPEHVFPFFADAANLERLTPPWLRFRIVSPLPVQMRVGAVIDYRLRVRGVPIRWRGEITVWEPPHRFVDEQRRGPYASWVHEHRFDPVAEGTRASDHVRYAPRGGRLANRLLVQRDLERVFAYRARALAEAFPAR